MRILLVTLAVLVAASAPAHAGWKIDRATAIAEIVWQDPCEGRVTLVWQDLGDVFAADGLDCLVRINNAGSGWGWPVFCTLMIHEYGHLAGYRDPANPTDPVHARNPRSVMHTPMTTIDPRCFFNGRPYLERHGVLSPRVPPAHVRRPLPRRGRRPVDRRPVARCRGCAGRAKLS